MISKTTYRISMMKNVFNRTQLNPHKLGKISLCDKKINFNNKFNIKLNNTFDNKRLYNTNPNNDIVHELINIKHDLNNIKSKLEKPKLPCNRYFVIRKLYFTLGMIVFLLFIFSMKCEFNVVKHNSNKEHDEDDEE